MHILRARISDIILYKYPLSANLYITLRCINFIERGFFGICRRQYHYEFIYRIFYFLCKRKSSFAKLGDILLTLYHKMMHWRKKPVENIVGKEENPGNQIIPTITGGRSLLKIFGRGEKLVTIILSPFAHNIFYLNQKRIP